jgi:GNAT superfamily N-acetyltransferase
MVAAELTSPVRYEAAPVLSSLSVEDWDAEEEQIAIFAAEWTPAASPGMVPRMADWSIRAFEAGDYMQVRTLWKASEGIGLDDSDSPEGLEAFLSRNPGLSAVADSGGTIVGAVLCGHDGRRGFIYHLIVAQSHRRRGVGTKLVSRCLAVLHERRIPKCHVMMFRTNDDAKQFWLKQGAKERTDLILASLAT